MPCSLHPCLMRLHPTSSPLFNQNPTKLFSNNPLCRASVSTLSLPGRRVGEPTSLSFESQSTHTRHCIQTQQTIASPLKQSGEDRLHSSHGLGELGDESERKVYVEMLRRRKIGLANKGKTPWNKGKKHDEETRERIRRRTIEALSDPKVRKKMSECPHVHTDQSKARIGFALRRVWSERLRKKRLQEKLYLIWADSVAEAAKHGGYDQQELSWDSYQKMKEEIMREYDQLKAEKEKAKEFARLRAEKEAKARAENREKRVREREVKKRKARAVRELKKKTRTLKKDQQEMATPKEMTLKRRLAEVNLKFHREKHKKGLVNIKNDAVVGPQPSMEKLNLEFVKMERMRRSVSLADQIRDIKIRKAESTANEELMLFSDSLSRRGVTEG
ncbi:hypothetical protein QJS04_geneDACA011017 [Acorus gramineus]|uniref:Nuclease associated modular domain-containing protein n=1 Tax=Acorus gramineus TaxID=55184 RepID=A0AAV9BIH9_ACOGR|nr:hypothetical protein QJS04_geneDACA011017 [Acorus gramineus]